MNEKVNEAGFFEKMLQKQIIKAFENEMKGKELVRAYIKGETARVEFREGSLCLDVPKKFVGLLRDREIYILVTPASYEVTVFDKTGKTKTIFDR